jgi:hypothetical protein
MKQKITTAVTTTPHPLPEITPNLNPMLILLNIFVFILSNLCQGT